MVNIKRLSGQAMPGARWPAKSAKSAAGDGGQWSMVINGVIDAMKQQTKIGKMDGKWLLHVVAMVSWEILGVAKALDRHCHRRPLGLAAASLHGSSFPSGSK